MFSNVYVKYQTKQDYCINLFEIFLNVTLLNYPTYIMENNKMDIYNLTTGTSIREDGIDVF